MAWYQVLMIVLSVFGMGWAMYANLGSKIDKANEKMADRIREIIKEIRDSNLNFHGRISKMEVKHEK